MSRRWKGTSESTASYCTANRILVTPLGSMGEICNGESFIMESTNVCYKINNIFTTKGYLSSGGHLDESD